MIWQLRGLDSNQRLRGYEPREIPTSPPRSQLRAIRPERDRRLSGGRRLPATRSPGRFGATWLGPPSGLPSNCVHARVLHARTAVREPEPERVSGHPDDGAARLPGLRPDRVVNGLGNADGRSHAFIVTCVTSVSRVTFCFSAPDLGSLVTGVTFVTSAAQEASHLEDRQDRRIHDAGAGPARRCEELRREEASCHGCAGRLERARRGRPRPADQGQDHCPRSGRDLGGCDVAERPPSAAARGGLHGKLRGWE